MNVKKGGRRCNVEKEDKPGGRERCSRDRDSVDKKRLGPLPFVNTLRLLIPEQSHQGSDLQKRPIKSRA